MRIIKTYETYEDDLLQKQLNKNLVTYSSNRSSLNVLRDLLKKGADPNCDDYNGLSPLHYACVNHFDKAVELLVEYGADVNKKSADGLTPFTLLTRFFLDYSYHKHEKSFKKIIDILIKNGANIDDKIENKYFDDYVNRNLVEYIIDTYPEKYEELLMIKKIDKYNL